MTLILDALQLLSEVSPTLPTSTPSAPPTLDANTMYSKDWWTIGVGITAGLGAAVIAGFVQAWKAKHEARLARDNALWEYHRVLTDISADISGFMGDTVEGYDDGTHRDRIKGARKAAYPYFHLFPKQERLKLTYPTSNDRYGQLPHEDQAQIDGAITALDSYLTKKGRRKTK
jgi:hypothetical protein